MTHEMEAVFMHLRTCLGGNEKGLRLCRQVFEHLQAREAEIVRLLATTYDLEQQIVQYKQRLGEHVPSGQRPPGEIHDAFRLDDCTGLLPSTMPAFAFLTAILPATIPALGALQALRTQIIGFDTQCRKLRQQLQAREHTATPNTQQGPAAPQPPEE